MSARTISSRNPWTILIGLFVLGMAVWPYYIDIRIPGVGGLNPQRALLIVICGIFVLNIMFNDRERARLSRLVAGDKLFFFYLLGFFVLRVVSALASGSMKSVIVALFEIVSNLLVFLIVVRVCGKPEKRDLLVKVIVLSGFLSILLAFPELLLKRNIFAPFATDDGRQLIVSLGTELQRGDNYRIRGVFENPLTLVHFLVTVLPLFFVSWLCFKWKAASVLFYFALIIVLFNTWSRIGVAVVFASTLAAVWFLTKSRRLRIFYFLLACSVAAIGAIVSPLQDIADELIESPARMAQLYNGVLAIQDRPLLGYGPSNEIGNVIYETSLREPGSIPMWESNALTTDNRYLTIALESGLISLAFFVGFSAIIVKRAYRASRRKLYANRRDEIVNFFLLVSVVGSLAVLIVLSIYTVIPLLFMCFGLLYAGTGRLSNV